MKAVRIGAVVGLILSSALVCAPGDTVNIDAVELFDAQGQKFFWCKEGVPVAVVQELLRLMNTCLEQKITNDVFLEILGKLQDQIKLITLSLDEKTALQKNIQFLINTLKKQSKSKSRELKTMIKAVTQLS